MEAAPLRPVAAQPAIAKTTPDDPNFSPHEQTPSPMASALLRRRRRTGVQSENRPQGTIPDGSGYESHGAEYQRNRRALDRQPSKCADTQECDTCDDPDRSLYSTHIACHDYTSLLMASVGGSRSCAKRFMKRQKCPIAFPTVSAKPLPLHPVSGHT